MWGGKIRSDSQSSFSSAGFLFQFLIAGINGSHLAVASLNWQTQGSYYVVAHFH